MGIEKTTYKDQVISYIYNLLLEGQLNPGDRVKESHLSAEIGISRAPIREALKELMSSGIVDYRPQVGNFIAQLSPKEIVDAYTTRGVLEGFAVMSCMELFSRPDISYLSSLTEQMKVSAEQGDSKMVTEVGGDFHDFMVGKNDNIQLLRLTNGLSLKLHILFSRHWARLYSPAEIESRHQQIVAALVSGERSNVEMAIRQHYIESGQKIAELHKKQEKQE